MAVFFLLLCCSVCFVFHASSCFSVLVVSFAWSFISFCSGPFVGFFEVVVVVLCLRPDLIAPHGLVYVRLFFGRLFFVVCSFIRFWFYVTVFWFLCVSVDFYPVFLFLFFVFMFGSQWRW
jgi:hypothetical protein